MPGCSANAVAYTPSGYACPMLRTVLPRVPRGPIEPRQRISTQPPANPDMIPKMGLAGDAGVRKKQLNVRFSDEEYEAVREAAEAEDVPVATFIRTAAVAQAQAEGLDSESHFLAWWAVLLSMLRPGRGTSK